MSFHEPLSPIVVLIVAINTAASVAGATYLRHRNIRYDLSTLLNVGRFSAAVALVGAIASLAPLVVSAYSLIQQEIQVGLSP